MLPRAETSYINEFYSGFDTYKTFYINTYFMSINNGITTRGLNLAFGPAFCDFLTLFGSGEKGFSPCIVHYISRPI